MGSLPQPIPIVSLLDSSCTLLCAKIDGVLAQVGSRPVFPISINGKIRSGKSTLMNKVIRDLEARRGIRNLDSSYGFPSCGGRNRKTIGINLWPIPYFITIAGEEVAVLLLDTQGLYDEHTSPRQNVLIPVISTLLSSVILFNCVGQVDYEDLRRISEFSEIASSLPVALQVIVSYLARDGSHSQKLDLQTSWLKQLIIIERNSPADGQFRFGIHNATQVPEESPQNCFRSTFKLDNGNALDEIIDRASEIRHKILDHFKDVNMCLLPYPGQAFVDQAEGQGVGPSDQFNDTVHMLIDTMLSLENVPEYKLSVHEIRNRLEIIIRVCDNVDVYLTDAASEEEMTRDLRYRCAEAKSVNYYGEQMIKYLAENKSASQVSLKIFHRVASDRTMTKFEGLRGIKDKALETMFRQKIKRQTWHVFFVFEDQLRRDIEDASAAKRARNEKISKYTRYVITALVGAGALGILVCFDMHLLIAVKGTAICNSVVTLITANPHLASMGVSALIALIVALLLKDKVTFEEWAKYYQVIKGVFGTG